MNDMLENIITLASFKSVIEKMRKVDTKQARGIEQELIKATEETHKRIRQSEQDSGQLLIVLYRELIQVEAITSHYNRNTENIFKSEAKLWQHAVNATELFFDSIEKDLLTFFGDKEKLALRDLKDGHRLFEGVSDAAKSIKGTVLKSNAPTTLVEEIISKRLSPDIIKKKLGEIFENANRSYGSKWEEEIKSQTPNLIELKSISSKLDLLSDSTGYTPGAVEITGAVGIASAVVGTAGLAAGWHTLSYSLFTVFPPVAVFTLIATAGIAVWNKDKALEKRKEEIRKTINEIHKQTLLKIDQEKMEELGNLSIRQAMVENSKKIVNNTVGQWRKVINGNLGPSHFEELHQAAQSHIDIVKRCIAELDQDTPKEH